MAGLFGGGLQRIRRQAGYLAPRIAREEERTTPAPIVRGTQARTREQAQMGGLIGGSYKSPRAQGWWAEVMSDPFTALGGRAAFDRKYAAQAAEDEARRMAPILSAMTPEQQAVYNANPEKWGEFMAQNYAPQKVTAGDTLIMRGDTSKPFFAPKTGMDGGVPYAQTYGANGLNTRYGPRRPSTPEEIIKQQEARRPRIDNTGQAITATSFGEDGTPTTRVLHRDPQNAGGGNDMFRPATSEDRARWNLPAEGAFKINVRTGEPASISGARAANDFSQTEIRQFRDKADGLYILKNAVQQYIDTLKKMGGPQLLDTPFNAENTQALKSAHGLITAAIKDAETLGALDAGVQNLVNAIISDPVGFGTFGKSTESISRAADELNKSIEFKLSRVPEEYRAGSTGQAPSARYQPGQIDVDDDTGDRYRFKGGDETNPANWERVP